MNAYLCYTDYEIQHIEWEDYSVGAGHYENYTPTDLIFSETRGQARAMFTSEHDLEFTAKVHIILVERNIDRSNEFAAYGDPLWAKAVPDYFYENSDYD